MKEMIKNRLKFVSFVAMDLSKHRHNGVQREIIDNAMELVYDKTASELNSLIELRLKRNENEIS